MNLLNFEGAALERQKRDRHYRENHQSGNYEGLAVVVLSIIFGFCLVS